MFRYVPGIVLDTGYRKPSRPQFLNLRNYNQSGKLVIIVQEEKYNDGGMHRWGEQ